MFKNNLQHLENKAGQIIADYFLHDIQGSITNEISFGQYKLLNLACCVANGAELLLLDEPVAGISPHNQTAITPHLQQQGKTMLMIEHDTDFIEATAEHFLFLDGSILNQFTTFAKLKNSRQAADAYF
ncbi:hypothetical protein JCM14076_01650 [Methylosoma difficile]